MTNTSVLPIVGVCLYETAIAPESVFYGDFEDYGDEEPIHKEEDWDKFDIDAYRRWVGEVAAKIVKEVGDEYLVGEKYGIKAVTSGGAIVAPRHYNLWNGGGIDTLDIDVEVADNFKEIAIANLMRWKEENGAASQYVRDNFTSYDGFHSFIPSSLDGIADCIGADEDIDRIVGAYTALCLADCGYFDKDERYTDNSPFDETATRLYEEISGKCFDDFMTTEID